MIKKITFLCIVFIFALGIKKTTATCYNFNTLTYIIYSDPTYTAVVNSPLEPCTPYYIKFIITTLTVPITASSTFTLTLPYDLSNSDG
ncbi:MAG TPA: hypothetical protein VK809_06555, partial [Bacteroidia bacterium]|nr:hypothetical protein [Bacteroidia bacterium]